MKKLLTFLFIFVAFTVSCRRTSAYLPELERADSLMFVHPDSALMILTRLDSTASFRGEERARFALLMTQARSRNYIRPANDSLIRIATDYYGKHGPADKLAWSYVYMSDVNRDMGNDSMALFYIKEANKLSTQLMDSVLIYYTEYFWGNMLERRHPYDECIPHLINAYNYAKEMNKRDWIISNLNEIGDAYINTKRYNEARKYLMEALGYLEGDSTHRYAASINGRIALSYFAQDKSEEALRYVNAAISAVPKINNYGTSFPIYALKGSILSKMCEYDSAETYINKCTDSHSSLRMIYEKNMASLEKSRGNYQKAVDHFERYAIYKDSLEDMKLADKVAELDKRYDMSEVRADKEKAELQNRILMLALVCAVMLAVAAVVAIMLIIARKKRQMAMMDAAREAMINDVANCVRAETSRLLDEERGVGDRLRQRIIEMDTLVGRIRSIDKMPDSKRVHSKADLVLDESDKMHLAMLVDECFNGYSTSLRSHYPRLTDDDMALINMIKIGVPNSDMSLLLGISDSALKKRKYRMKVERLLLDKDDILEDWVLDTSV